MISMCLQMSMVMADVDGLQYLRNGQLRVIYDGEISARSQQERRRLLTQNSGLRNMMN